MIIADVGLNGACASFWRHLPNRVSTTSPSKRTVPRIPPWPMGLGLLCRWILGVLLTASLRDCSCSGRNAQPAAARMMAAQALCSGKCLNDCLKPQYTLGAHRGKSRVNVSRELEARFAYGRERTSRQIKSPVLCGLMDGSGSDGFLFGGLHSLEHQPGSSVSAWFKISGWAIYPQKHPRAFCARGFVWLDFNSLGRSTFRRSVSLLGEGCLHL